MSEMKSRAIPSSSSQEESSRTCVREKDSLSWSWWCTTHWRENLSNPVILRTFCRLFNGSLLLDLGIKVHTYNASSFIYPAVKAAFQTQNLLDLLQNGRRKPPLFSSSRNNNNDHRLSLSWGEETSYSNYDCNVYVFSLSLSLFVFEEKRRVLKDSWRLLLSHDLLEKKEKSLIEMMPPQAGKETGGQVEHPFKDASFGSIISPV